MIGELAGSFVNGIGGGLFGGGKSTPASSSISNNGYITTGGPYVVAGTGAAEILSALNSGQGVGGFIPRTPSFDAGNNFTRGVSLGGFDITGGTNSNTFVILAAVAAVAILLVMRRR